MSDDYIDQLLASGPLVDDLLALARAGTATPRLRVLTLAMALAQAAEENGAPDDLVLDALRSCLAAARASDPTVE